MPDLRLVINSTFSTDVQFFKRVVGRDGFRHSLIQASGDVTGIHLSVLCLLRLAPLTHGLGQKKNLIEWSFQGK